MLGTGKNRTAPFVLTLLSALMISNVCLPQIYYYTCSYEEPQWGTNLLFSQINLDSKILANTVSLPVRGQVFLKNPIIVERGNRTKFIVSAFDGLSGKNTQLLPETVSNYGVIGQNLNVLRIGEIEGVQIHSVERPGNSETWVKFINRLGGHKRGLINLRSDNGVQFSRIEEDPYIDSDYPAISGFRYFEKIAKRNHSLYWNTTSNGRYLLSIDIQNNILIDSLRLGSSGDYSNLFGLSDNDSLIYAFFMNYNYLGHPLSMQKLEIDPSYVKIFSSADFSLVDSIDIIYPPIDSGYVGRETGSIDKVGPYFVYFFFSGEDYRYFSPAMLFIFDTRTNEATWLRVGWR
jgi:hypothetical protein